MHTIKFTGYILYTYYQSRKAGRLAYPLTLFSMTVFSFFHLQQIVQFLAINGWCSVPPAGKLSGTRLLISLTILPLYFLNRFLFPRQAIPQLEKKYGVDWDRVFRGRIWLLVYSVLSMILLFLLTLWGKK